MIKLPSPSAGDTILPNPTRRKRHDSGPSTTALRSMGSTWALQQRDPQNSGRGRTYDTTGTQLQEKNRTLRNMRAIPMAVSDDMLRWLSSRNCSTHPGSFDLAAPAHEQTGNTRTEEGATAPYCASCQPARPVLPTETCKLQDSRFLLLQGANRNSSQVFHMFMSELARTFLQLLNVAPRDRTFGP